MTCSFEQAKTYREVLEWSSLFLREKNVEVAGARWLLKERFGLTNTDLVFKAKDIMSNEDKKQFYKDIHDFAKGMPAQFIVGHEWFFDRQFKVTKDTLIPRPETEEWVDNYLKTLPDRPLKVLEIGTGTGVIAITHKLGRPMDEVIATDISNEALKVAGENAKKMDAEITFLHGDLTQPVKDLTFDLIVSNPPYIGREEWNQMDVSVREFEPKSALFAENEGYKIYERMSLEIPQIISGKSIIILEIGYSQGEQIKRIFERAFPTAKVNVIKDMSGLDRVCRIDIR